MPKRRKGRKRPKRPQPKKPTRPAGKDQNKPRHCWRHWAVSLTFLGIVLTAVFGLPSILPKFSIVYVGTESFEGMVAPTFKVTNEGLIDVHGVTSRCLYKTLEYKTSTWRVADNTISIVRSLGNLEPGEEATFICPINQLVSLPEQPIGGSLETIITYRPSFRLWHSEISRYFEARNGIALWVPQPLF